MEELTVRTPEPSESAEAPATEDVAAPASAEASGGAEAQTPRRSERPYGGVSLLVTLLLTAVMFVLTLWPMASPVLLGALLAGFTMPWRRKLSLRWRNRTAVAGLITATAVVLVLLPLGLLALVIAGRLQTLVRSGVLAHWVGPTGLWSTLAHRYPLLTRLAPERMVDQVTAAIGFVASSIPQVLTSVADGLVGMLLTALTLFYLLRDGDAVFARLERALPLEPRHTRAIAHEFEQVGQAFIVGTLGTSALQGLLAGLGYFALGVPEALLLGVVTGVISIVPIGGSAIVWIPVGIYLFATGESQKGVALLVYGAVIVVGVVDNLVRPWLTRGGLDLHPLLVFLSLFGGLAAFGPSGLYLGPLFVALFMSVAQIYEREMATATTAPVQQDAEDSPLWKALRALRRGRGP